MIARNLDSGHSVTRVRGEFRVLFLYEAAEAIRLDALRSLLPGKDVGVSAGLPQQVPQYLRFERPPVVESISPIQMESGDQVQGKIKYYDYGIVSIEFTHAFECEWHSLLSQASRWIAPAELESRSQEVFQTALKRSSAAMTNPYDTWLREDYFVAQVEPLRKEDGAAMTAADLLSSHGHVIAQLVRGEPLPLSERERQEVLQSSISYSERDLLVVGWTGALVYGEREGAATTIQLLEYANTQLLEFRYYDGLLARLLEGVYRSLERKRGVLAAWGLSREAARLNTIRLDVMELTEKLDNAIKFLSDMYYARLYSLAASKVGVPDYRRLVEQKVNTAGELYRFMVEEFNHTRSFVLEVAVVAILIVDLFFLFRGK